MATPTILSSPFLNIQVIDGLLYSSQSQEITQKEKVRLLSAKVHLLSQRNSSSNSNITINREEDELTTLKVRLELSRAYLDLVPQDVKSAESELGMIDGSCKGMIKRLSKTKHDSAAQKASNARASASDAMRLLADLKELRIQALNEMIRVEAILGREARADRWRKAISMMEEEQDGDENWYKCECFQNGTALYTVLVHLVHLVHLRDNVTEGK